MWHSTTQVLAARYQHRGRHPFHAHEGSQKNEAPSVFETTGNCCLHRTCLRLNQQHTLHKNRSIQVHDGCRFHHASSTETVVSSIRSCAAQTALCGSSWHPCEHPTLPSPGRARRSAESVPAVQVFPLQLVTLDLNLSPASLQLVILELSLMPASLTSRSTRSITSLPSSPHMTQANTKI